MQANEMPNEVSRSLLDQIAGSSDAFLTEQDLVSLFPPDVDTGFLQQFTSKSRRDMQSAPMECIFQIPKFSLQDAENSRASLLNANDATNYEIITRTVQIPRGFLQSVNFNVDCIPTVFATLNITNHLWASIVQEKGEAQPFRCAACSASPAKLKSAQVLKEILGFNAMGHSVPLGNSMPTVWYYRVKLFPCFPVCDKERCHLLAQTVGG